MTWIQSQFFISGALVCDGQRSTNSGVLWHCRDLIVNRVLCSEMQQQVCLCVEAESCGPAVAPAGRSAGQAPIAVGASGLLTPTLRCCCQ